PSKTTIGAIWSFCAVWRGLRQAGGRQKNRGRVNRKRRHAGGRKIANSFRRTGQGDVQKRLPGWREIVQDGGRRIRESQGDARQCPCDEANRGRWTACQQIAYRRCSA